MASPGSVHRQHLAKDFSCHTKQTGSTCYTSWKFCLIMVQHVIFTQTFQYPEFQIWPLKRSWIKQLETWCLAWWNTFVSDIEILSECLCLSRCTNLSRQSTERVKISTSSCHFWHPGCQHFLWLRSLLCHMIPAAPTAK